MTRWLATHDYRVPAIIARPTAMTIAQPRGRQVFPLAGGLHRRGIGRLRADAVAKIIRHPLRVAIPKRSGHGGRLRSSDPGTAPDRWNRRSYHSGRGDHGRIPLQLQRAAIVMPCHSRVTASRPTVGSRLAPNAALAARKPAKATGQAVSKHSAARRHWRYGETMSCEILRTLPSLRSTIS